MDFGKAALLIAVVFGLTEFGKRLLGPRLSADSRIVTALAIVVGQAAVWLMAQTAWAHEQVIGTKPLDELNTGSLILVGLLVAGGAAFGRETLQAVKNVGTNQPTVYDPKYGTPATKAPTVTYTSSTATTAPSVNVAPLATPLPEPPPGYGPSDAS